MTAWAGVAQWGAVSPEMFPAVDVAILVVLVSLLVLCLTEDTPRGRKGG